jgi:hypothetical protein
LQSVCRRIFFIVLIAGTLQCWHQIPCHAADETFPRHGATFGWREDCSCSRSSLRYPQVCPHCVTKNFVSQRPSYQPAPFFVLDEVDAALDNTNVAKIANYIRSQASDSFQFIVISLKGSLYERGNSLVGIYRDQDVNSSRTLTLDVSDCYVCRESST